MEIAEVNSEGEARTLASSVAAVRPDSTPSLEDTEKFSRQLECREEARAARATPEQSREDLPERYGRTRSSACTPIFLYPAPYSPPSSAFYSEAATFANYAIEVVDDMIAKRLFCHIVRWEGFDSPEAVREAVGDDPQ